MNLDEAVSKHAEWKVKLRSAISKQEQLDAATIGKDDCCPVGQWLYGDGRTKWGSKPEFQKCVEQHKAFHTEAGKVAQLINAKRYGEAERAIGGGTSYAAASNNVGMALLALKKAAAL
jgi:methyl-accepting chemotaxis protein